ncbi:hypothetical protein [Loktanella sp. Alg231-35]|uniref:hypothetical protein n=1 Tax=Loktanella sp. Alg231-35 TaxID=1922220 RepID=UPI001F2968C9|nr:hypothetical protein [Loktanella sp. Alg231-35]
MTNPNDDMLDDLFGQARAQQPVAPSDDLIARVLADAAGVQHAPIAQVADQPGAWARIMDAIGGWPALSGLAAATVAGVWVGIAPPSSVSDLTASLMGDAVSVDLFSTNLLLDAGALSDG